MKFTKQQLLFGGGLLLAGFFLGWLLFSGSDGHDHDLTDAEMSQHIEDAHTDEEGNIVYTCSMHPQVRETEPGNCPICGMELIPAGSTGQAAEDDFSMVMTHAAMKLAQIQTAPAELRIPEKEIELPGRIKADERRTTSVTAHVSGRITNTYIDFTGAPIREGEPMAAIYSPELVSAQRELIEAARRKDQNPALYESVRQKFRLWEFSDAQIDAIEQRGEVQRELEILSPANGFVLSRNITNQQHVAEGSVLYDVANLDQVWVVLEAYEEDLPWLQVGSTLTFRTRNQPGQQHEATVSYIDPVLNEQKRTVGIRADVANPGNHFKPEMLVRGTLHSRMDEEKLMVPASAVLWTGPRSLVYVMDPMAETPRFEAREVELGPKAGDYFVIEEGLMEGEEVVFNGNFRIDSEFQLADKFSMMNRDPGSGAVPDHRHGVEQELEDLSSGVTDDFREEFTHLLNVYLELKDGLIESDLAGATQQAGQFQQMLESIGQHRMDGDAHVAWMESYQNLAGHIDPMVTSGNLESMRADFRFFSDQLIEAVKMYGIEGVVYQQYCPMAFGDEGASWLSEEEQIQNPYLPETMIGCGEVIERIE